MIMSVFSRISNRYVRQAGVCALGLALLLSALPAQAFTPPPAAQETAYVSAGGSGVVISYRASQSSSPAALLEQSAWTGLDAGTVRIPAQLIAVRLDDERAVQPAVRRVVSRRYSGELPAALNLPQIGEEISALPQSPLVVLRESRARGVRVVVLALLAYYQQAGQWRALTEFDAEIPGAQVLDDNPIDFTAEMRGAAAPTAATNPVAGMTAYKLTVTSGGIQRVTGAALAAAGLNITATVPQNLRVYHANAQVAIQVTGAQDGQFNLTDEVRFYAPPPGDRWNKTDLYWLTVQTAGQRMALQNASVITLSTVSNALEYGVWKNDSIYDSQRPGPDADHWFSLFLAASAGVPARATVNLTSTLPPLTDALTLTVTGKGYTGGVHQLVSIFNGVLVTQTWSGTADYTQTYTIGVATVPPAATGRAFSVTLRAVSAGSADQVYVDRLVWQRPVQLNFAGNGWQFTSHPAQNCYQASNFPSGGELYDVTIPTAPIILTTTGGASPQFCLPPNRQLVVGGAGMWTTPSVAQHSAVDLLTARATKVIYIAPQAFMSTLQPLVNLRVSQGYTVTLVDVQHIYDTWSMGLVSPLAIRSFIQHAVAAWTPTPIAYTLVGDGTVDPFDITKKGSNNVNIIPPYMADVDPLLGEVACEACFAQVDGADPLSDVLPDTLLGRLPVRNTTELAAVVHKIVAYEHAAQAPWMAKIGFVADNFRTSAGGYDPYGDFVFLSEQSIATLPAEMQIERMYYDPYQPTAQGVPYREMDSALAHTRVISMLNAGAAIVQYGGHANYFQWAETQNVPGRLLFIDEPFALTNGGKLPIVLGMTCFTSAFQTPLVRGMGIDEQMVLAANGGAIATWGPSGLSQIYTHERLAAGFYQGLSQTPRATRTIGDLVINAYLYTYYNSACCLDSIQSYVLLGDPITRARLMTKSYVYLPIVNR